MNTYLTILAVLPFLTSLGATGVLAAYIMLGQAHFIISYLYQWKAGKLSIARLATYVLVSIFLLGFLWLMPYAHSIRYISFVAGFLFAIHFLFDSVKINNLNWTRPLSALLFSNFIIYIALLFHAIFNLTLAYPSAIVSLIVISLGFLFSTQNDLRPSGGLVTLGIAFVGLLLLLFEGQSIPAEYIFGATVLAHYFQWYIYYFVKLQRRRFWMYLFDAVILNALCILLWIVYIKTGYQLLQFMFLPTYFYGWTILHILFSVRIEDYRLALAGLTLRHRAAITPSTETQIIHSPKRA